MAKQLFEGRQADLLAALSQKAAWCRGTSFPSPLLEAAIAALKGRELLRRRVPELPTAHRQSNSLSQRQRVFGLGSARGGVDSRLKVDAARRTARHSTAIRHVLLRAFELSVQAGNAERF